MYVRACQIAIKNTGRVLGMDTIRALSGDSYYVADVSIRITMSVVHGGAVTPFGTQPRKIKSCQPTIHTCANYAATSLKFSHPQPRLGDRSYERHGYAACTEIGESN